MEQLSLRNNSVGLYFGDVNCGQYWKGYEYSPLFNSLAFLIAHKGGRVLFFQRGRPSLKSFFSKQANPRQLHLLQFLRAFVYALISDKKFDRKGFKRRLLTAYWTRVLTLTKPRIIIGVHPSPELCRAARAISIPVYDYQHGDISPTDSYYKAIHDRSDTDIPSGYLCWHEAFVPGIKAILDNRISVTVLPHAFLERFRLKLEDDEWIYDMMSGAQQAQRQILISLGWGMTKNWDGESVGLPSWFGSVNAWNNLEDFSLVVRAHPTTISRYDREKVKFAILRFFKVPVTIDCDGKVPLLLTLRFSFMNITRSSGTALEAWLMGVPTLYVKEKNDPTNNNVCEKAIGMPTALSVEEFQNQIRKIMANKGALEDQEQFHEDKPKLLTPESLWRMDSL